MATLIVGLLRLASIAICLIVLASFATFVVAQTKSASTHQQEQVAGNFSGAKTHPREGSVRRTLDEISNELTSPFAGVVSGSSSEWVTRSVRLLIALLIYGFALGYLARVVRVRT